LIWSSQDPASLREVKLLVNLMVIQSQIAKIITATARWEPSVDIFVCIPCSVEFIDLRSAEKYPQLCCRRYPFQ
jgi:hypothetical protein